MGQIRCMIIAWSIFKAVLSMCRPDNESLSTSKIRILHDMRTSISISIYSLWCVAFGSYVYHTDHLYFI